MINKPTYRCFENMILFLMFIKKILVCPLVETEVMRATAVKTRTIQDQMIRINSV